MSTASAEREPSPARSNVGRTSGVVLDADLIPVVLVVLLIVLRARDGSRSAFKMLVKNSMPSLTLLVTNSSRARLPGPPHNPGIRELMSGKRKWASSLTREHAKAGFKGWHERGYIPHRDEPGLVQMVTFHVLDSFPRSLRSEWAALFEIEKDSERRKKLQAYLDKGRGDCH